MDPKPELTSLPDVPSRAIVSLLPLQQVITTLPLLHSRFAPIRESVLKSNQRLVLYIGDQKKIQAKKCRSQLGVPFASHLVDSSGSPLYPDTSFHRLHLLTLSQPSVEQLSTLMPNITYLEVAIANVDLSVVPNLISLLTFWGPTLQTLKLLIQEFKPANDEHLQPGFLSIVASHLRLLIRLINSQLLALEHLSLDLDDSLIDRYRENRIQKIGFAILDVRLFQNGQFNRQVTVPIGHPLPPIDIDDAVRRLHVVLQEVSDFLNREPPNETVNVEEVLAQANHIQLQLMQKHRFTSGMLFKGDNEDSETLEFLSILGQLKEFSLDSGRSSPSMQAFLLRTLDKYGSNQLTSIAIAIFENNYWGSSNWHLEAFARSRFASRFTRFPGQFYSQGPEDTPLLPAFTHLKAFTINWIDLGPNQMARLGALASLPNLNCLRLMAFNKATPLLNASFASLPAFSSLIVLEIFLCNFGGFWETHEGLRVPYWAHLFPAVQIIKLVNDGSPCRSCFPNEMTLRSLPIETVLPCVKQLLAPLRELPSLRKIFYQPEIHFNTVTVEFTPEGELLQTHKYAYYTYFY